MFALGMAFALSLAFQPLAIRQLRRRSLLDHPNHRSSHSVPTLRGGGIAVLSAMLVSAAIFSSHWTSLWLLVPVSIAAALGLVEDIRGISVPARLLVQTIVSVVVAIWAFSGTVPLPLALVCLAAIWIIGSINAVNFMDGINGITATFGTVAGLAYLAYLEHTTQFGLSAIAAALAGACLGFVPYNWGNAKVFLGDVGSYGIGAAAGGLAVLTWAATGNLLVAAGPMLIYVLDSGWVIVKRSFRRENIFEAHRGHVYQRLTDAGLSHQAVCFIVGSCMAVLSIVGYLSLTTSRFGGLHLVVCFAVVGAYLSSPHMVASLRRLKNGRS